MAIRVNVRFHNMLRHHTGVEQEAVELPDSSQLNAVLEDVVRRHGQGVSRVLFTADGRVSSNVVIFRNGALLPRGEGNVALADGDELLLFPAISGG